MEAHLRELGMRSRPALESTTVYRECNAPRMEAFVEYRRCAPLEVKPKDAGRISVRLTTPTFDSKGQVSLDVGWPHWLSPKGPCPIGAGILLVGHAPGFTRQWSSEWQRIPLPAGISRVDCWIRGAFRGKSSIAEWIAFVAKMSLKRCQS